MKGLLSRRPSAAMVVALVALVMASVGTGYAAFKLPNNSVGTKQIKKNAVTTAKVKKEAITAAKVKKGSLTGTQINLAKLGTVPLASTATTAGTANALSPLETTHLVGAAGEPGFEEGSGNIPGGGGINFTPVGFFKDHEGVVHLEGFAQVPGEGRVFTLPSGFRPPSGITQLYEPGGEVILIFGSNVFLPGLGDVSGLVFAPEGAAILSGITFRAGS